MQTPIPVYAMNLKERTDRFDHIQAQFANKPEFQLTVVEATRHENGCYGVWQTIRSIFLQDTVQQMDFIILCEDDHVFTEHYDKDALLTQIETARLYNADMVSGGPSWINSMAQVTDHLFWMEGFSGLQFTIVFKKFYPRILNLDFQIGEVADAVFTYLSDQKFFIHPFISTQKEFGYSDATPLNNIEGRVEKLYIDCSERIQLSKYVKQYYAENLLVQEEEIDLDRVTIPTYIINLPERTDRRQHVAQQFAGRNEFTVTFIDAIKHEIGAFGLWLTMRKIVQLAIDNDDDVILICEDDHEFTEHYTKEYLLSAIIQASHQGADYLSGGAGGFGSAIPLSANRFWVSSLLSTQFIVIYKHFFQTIIDEPFDDDVKADLMLSSITSNKMLLYPFVSTQKDFGYSDVTPVHDSVEGLVTSLFAWSERRLQGIQSFHQSLQAVS